MEYIRKSEVTAERRAARRRTKVRIEFIVNDDEI